MSDEKTGDQGKPAAEGEQQPQWAKDLHTSLGEVGKGINTLVQFAETATRQMTAAPAAAVEEPDDGSDLLADTNLELLPRRAFAEKLLDSLGERVEGMLKPLEEAINRTGQSQILDQYTRQAEAFAAKTADFAEWGNEMQAIAKEQPTLPISRIYAIARSENPTKAKEMDTKYAPKPEETAKPGKRAPLSLAPSSDSSGSKNQRMSSDEAARAAWDETVAQFGNPFA